MNDATARGLQPSAYAVDRVPGLPDEATARLCNAVHGSAITNDGQLGSSDTVETMLTALAASSSIAPSERPRTKEWAKIMTRATVPKRPAWKPCQPPISPPMVFPSKPEPMTPALCRADKAHQAASAYIGAGSGDARPTCCRSYAGSDLVDANPTGRRLNRRTGRWKNQYGCFCRMLESLGSILDMRDTRPPPT